LRGRCLSYGEGITFFPVAEVIRDAAGITDLDSPEDARARIDALAGGSEHGAMVGAAVAELIGLAPGPLAGEDGAWAVRTFLEGAEGNPLFVEEMLAMLVDDGLLRPEDGRWVAGEEVERVAVPPTIQLLLAARLDRLDSEERAVAERASVEGKVFHRGAVVSL